ncbi:YycH family regulatory protein [Solibacillus sp. FSL K6-1523]|uniref:YycH family regulatory protein n=1 Tax=Solibacillus sp. FSL K6-1523 TaxID=2921471 RepID=UPI0030F577B5
MKYIEQIKSYLLTLLVLLSIILTLMIWNYKPEYTVIEEAQVDEIMISDTKLLQDVLKPYRLLYRQDDHFHGTVSNDVIQDIYDQLSTWDAHEVDLINSNLSEEQMNEMLRMNNRLTLFFNGEVPLQVFNGILTFNEKELPDASFTRLILDWTEVLSNNQLQLLFLNTERRVSLRSTIEISNSMQFMEEVVEPIKEYQSYIEVERDSMLSLYVAQKAMESIQYTYFMDKTSPDIYKNILFGDLSIVTRNTVNTREEKYNDGTSLMTVDTQNYILNYVYPQAESIAPIPSARLLLDSFDFINDHGGFTADFRFSSMNVGKHVTEYQLFVQGYPIHSSITPARITTIWGENRIYRYRRPYYSIDNDIRSFRTTRDLPSGEEVIEYIKNMDDQPFDEIDEVIVGYHLKQDTEKGLFLLDPSWFIISNNEWTRISPEQLGGTNDGLE